MTFSDYMASEIRSKVYDMLCEVAEDWCDVDERKIREEINSAVEFWDSHFWEEGIRAGRPSDHK